MPGFTVNGNASKTTILHIEAHKTSQEFVASAAIKKGQLVKIDAAGTVSPWAKTDLRNLCVGVAFSDAAINEYITIFTRGYAIVYGLSNVALTAGPVTFEAYDTVTQVGGVSGYNKFANTGTADQVIGWALDSAAGANALIRILLMD